MKLSVYLSHDIADILLCYGTIDEVVDKILVAGSQGIIDIMDKPNAPEKKGGRYYQVNIKEPNYIELMETHGNKSSKISLRRLLYWFVENEIYLELGWEIEDEFVDRRHSKAYMAITELKQALYKGKSHIPISSEYDDIVEPFKNLLDKLEEELWYAK